MQQLAGRRILIAEDNLLSAQQLAEHFRSARAIVLGPCLTLAAAERQAPGADLAILGLDLRGEEVFDLADQLRRSRVPFVFYSALDLSQIPLRFADVHRLEKPVAGDETLEVVLQELGRAELTIEAMLPRLRLSARLMMADANAADRLVEAALQLALDHPRPLSQVSSVAAWLHALMAQALQDRGRDLLN